MTQIQINSITGSAYPYTLYACDAYGNQCVLIATIPSTATFPLIITLPPQFNGAPAVGLKMIDSTTVNYLKTVKYSCLWMQRFTFSKTNNHFYNIY